MAQILDLVDGRLLKLPPAELAREVMKVPARKRLELILQRSDAASVVAAMEVRDFYFSVQEIGPDDALALLAMAKVEQLTHLFDIEWWEADHVRASTAIEWLDRVERASEHNLLAWLYQADFELLATLFKKWVRVELMPEDVDPAEARERLPRNTIDDAYFWEPLYPQYEDLLTRMLSLLFEVHPAFYRELMNTVMWAPDVEMEEDAYRFHRGRLEDLAVPDFYEALEVYRSITPQEITADKRSVEPSPEEPPPPVFAIALVPEGDLLDRALHGIRDRTLIDMIQMELASLANKVIVADRLSPDKPEALRRAVEKTVAGVNLGLELLSSGDLAVAASFLETVYLERLFRLAQTAISGVRNRVLKLVRRGWPSQWPEGMKCLDGEWLEQAELLMRRTPMLLRLGSETGPSSGEDFFRREEDVRKANRFVETVSHMGKLYEALAPDPGMLDRKLWRAGQVSGLAEVTLGSMFVTAGAWALLDGRRRLEPIPVERWLELCPLVQSGALRDVLQWVQSLFGDDGVPAGVREYLDSVLATFGEAMSGFTPENPPEPQMVPLLLFTEEE